MQSGGVHIPFLQSLRKGPGLGSHCQQALDLWRAVIGLLKPAHCPLAHCDPNAPRITSVGFCSPAANRVPGPSVLGRWSSEMVGTQEPKSSVCVWGQHRSYSSGHLRLAQARPGRNGAENSCPETAIHAVQDQAGHVVTGGHTLAAAGVGPAGGGVLGAWPLSLLPGCPGLTVRPLTRPVLP